jgi:cell division septal protein FtsQ
MRSKSARPRRQSAGHVKRPRPPLRSRIRRVLPRASRIFALLILAILSAGLVLVANGPWLRVARVAWAGQHYTPGYELQRADDRLRGKPLLTLDLSALRSDLTELPAVAEARVDAVLPDQLRITLVEKQAAFVWQTSAVRLVGAADGTLIGQVALRVPLPGDLASLQLIDDRRAGSHNVIVGDRIDPDMLAIALRLGAVKPALVGSAAHHLGVSLDDEHGFLLVADDPHWQAAFGLYGSDLGDGSSRPADRIEAQLAAIRTLFSLQPESRVSWLDVRNPGKVYWVP